MRLIVVEIQWREITFVKDGRIHVYRVDDGNDDHDHPLKLIQNSIVGCSNLLV